MSYQANLLNIQKRAYVHTVCKLLPVWLENGKRKNVCLNKCIFHDNRESRVHER